MSGVMFFSPMLFLFISAMMCWFLLRRGISKKTVMISQVASFVGVSLFAMISLVNRMAFAEETNLSVVPADKAMPFAIGLIGAALAVGLAAIATGMALSSAVPAAIAAMSENEKVFGKSLVLAIFGEAIVLYGFTIAFFILNNLKFLVGVA